MRVAACLVVAACTSTPKGPLVLHTPLAALQNTVVHVIASAAPAELDAIINTNSDDCTGLEKDATATYQGVTVPISDAYVAPDGSCHTVEVGPMAFDPAVIGDPPFVLQLADSTATWTITFDPTGSFPLPTMLVDGAAYTVTWAKGPPITQACVTMSQDTSSGLAEWAYECTDTYDSYPKPPIVSGTSVEFFTPQFLYEQAGASVDLTIGASGQFDIVGGACAGPARCLIDANAVMQARGVPVSH